MAVACSEDELLKIAEKILALDSAMRFAAILDLDGNILEGIMNENKTSLESQKQQEKFCKDAAKARKMREAYDRKLGKVRYVHTERENVTQITVYIKKYTIFITMEPELSVNKKFKIIKKIEIGHDVFEPLCDYYIKNRHKLRNNILTQYPSYVENLLFKSILKMKKISDEKLIDYLLVKCIKVN